MLCTAVSILKQNHICIDNNLFMCYNKLNKFGGDFRNEYHR